MTDENEYAEVCTHPEPATQAERIAALEAECRQHEQAVEYWQAQAKAERRKAADNLRLAAERATEIGELQRRVRELDSERAHYTSIRAGLSREVEAQIILNARKPLEEKIAQLSEKIEQLEAELGEPSMDDEWHS